MLRKILLAWGILSSILYMDQRRVYTRDLEVPSGNAVGTARAIARAYSVFATGGRELGLRRETQMIKV